MMKKMFFITALLFFVTLSIQNLHAQLKDEVGHTVTAWSDWSTTGCHKGIAWRLRQNYYTGNNNGYTWEYEVKNNYGRQVTFSYQFSESDVSSANTPMRKTLSPGQVYRNTSLPKASRINYFVFSVCFSANGRCKDECYSPCDNGTPNIPDCADSNGSTSNSNVSASSSNNQKVSPSTNGDTYIQPTKAQKQAEALNQLSGSLMDLAKSIDKAKAERRERQQKEAAELRENQNQERRKNEQANFEKSTYSLIQYVGGRSTKFEKYFSSLGYKYNYHEGIDNRHEDVFEHFSIQHLNDRSNFIFSKEEEKYMATLLNELAEIKDYITFYVVDNTIKNNGFAITKIKGHITKGHGEGVEQDYNYILKIAKTYLGSSPTESGSQKAQQNDADNKDYTVGSEPNYNFGKIFNGTNYVHVFHLSKNVKAATASCGCVSVEINSKIPNSVMTMFRGIANYKGPFAKSISVTYEDGTTETLYLKGELK